MQDEITKTDQDEMRQLYFMKVYSMERLEEHFKGKYTYNQIRDCIYKMIMGGVS